MRRGALVIAALNVTLFIAVPLAMVRHTVVVSPGYFIRRRELPVVGVFALLIRTLPAA